MAFVQKGDWLWHVNVHSVVIVESVSADGVYVTVRFSSFSSGTCTYHHAYADSDVICEAFAADCVPLYMAPCYVSDIYNDWIEAITYNEAFDYAKRTDIRAIGFAMKTENRTVFYTNFLTKRSMEMSLLNGKVYITKGIFLVAEVNTNPDSLFASFEGDI